MGIVEAGHDKAATKIHDLGLWSLQFHDVVGHPHGEDAVATNCQSLRAFSRSQRSGRIDYSGIDVAVDKNQVRFRLRSVLHGDAVLRLHRTGRGQQ